MRWALLALGLSFPALALERATFAGGCFWCMEPPFEKLEGVKDAISGYTGGDQGNPSYDDVSAGKTGHTESVQVIYDEKRITYEKLLDTFFRNMDPTDKDGQFVDRGKQYRPGIFYHDAKQKRAALKAKSALEKSGKFGKALVLEITELKNFYPAEDYHQDFYKKNPERYHQYRKSSGRDAYIDKIWGKAAK